MSGGVLVGVGVGAKAAYDGNIDGGAVGSKLADGSVDGLGVMDGTTVGCKDGDRLG